MSIAERTRQVWHARDGSLSTLAQCYQTRTTCRVCSSPDLELVLDLGVQFLPRFVKEPDYGLPSAPLTLVRCGRCGLLQLQHTTSPDLLFREFWYRSGINQTMKDALRDVVKSGLRYHSAGAWLDIGANDGTLLDFVPATFAKVACEPALTFKDELLERTSAVVSDYFSAQSCPGPYHVITSAAMFYDLDNPNSFVADIAKALHYDGVWVNQLNDAPTMLKQNAFDSICHEHLTYYDVPTLADMYRQHGLSICDISYNDINGGSVRIVARKSTRHRADLLGHPKIAKADCEAFANRIRKWKDRMLDLLHGPLGQTSTWAYGASTKGTVLLQYLGETSSILAVADRNPAKFGLRMAGSWLPIASEDTMRADPPAYLLVLPWAFKDEFVKRERPLLDKGTTMLYPLPSIELVL